MSLDLLQIYNELKPAVDLIDEKIDSLDGGTTQIRSKIINEKITETTDNWTVVADSIIGQLADAPKEVQVGFFFGLVRQLDKAYAEEAKKFVDELVEASPKPTPMITADELPALMEKRKEVVSQINAVMAMAETFGSDDFEKMEKPRRRGGAPKGKRGPRAISFFSWTIDNKEFDSLKDVIEVVPQYEKVADIRKALIGAGFNLTTPPAEINFTLPDGRTLVGLNGQTEVPNADDTEDAEDEDSEDNSE